MTWFFIIALALFGALFLWIGLRLRQHGHASALWPVASNDSAICQEMWQCISPSRG